MTLFNIYVIFGEVTKENFNLYYQKFNYQPQDDYYSEYYHPTDFEYLLENALTYFDEYFEDMDKYLVDILYSSSYPIYMYMYSMYMKNTSFLNKIESMHTMINEHTLEECYNYLGLSYPLDDNSVNKIKESIKICTNKAINLYNKEKKKILISNIS